MAEIKNNSQEPEAIEAILQEKDVSNVDDKALFVVSRKLKQHEKEIDQDRTLLKNRVAHLKAELAKAQKKIHDTKARAEDIKTIKEKRRKTKLVRDKTVHNVLGTKAHQVSKLKKQIIDSKVQAIQRRRECEQKVRSDAQNFKELKAKLKQKKAKELELKQQKIMERVAEQKEQVARRRKQREIEQKLEDAKRKEATEAEIQRMKECNKDLKQNIETLEQVERDWIEKLRGTQDDQKEAFAALEEALALVVE